MAPFAFVFLACLLPSWVSAKAVPSYELYDYDPVANTVRSIYYYRNGDRGDTAADNDDDDDDCDDVKNDDDDGLFLIPNHISVCLSRTRQ